MANMGTYLGKVLRFYASQNGYSLLALLYICFFGYFVLFYFGHLILALKFLMYTLYHSANLLGLSYLFSGVTFLVGLIAPFVLSVYAIFYVYEIKHKPWPRRQKFIVASLLVIFVPISIVFADKGLRAVAGTSALKSFVQSQELELGGQLPQEKVTGQ